MSRLREKLRERHAARSEVERVQVADLARRARLRPRPIPPVDPQHAAHVLTLWLVLPPGAAVTPGLLDHARGVGANIVTGDAEITIRRRVGGNQSEPYLVLEDAAFRDEVHARVERELVLVTQPAADWTPITAPVRLSPLEGESCELVVLGTGEPRLRLRVDGDLVLDADDRPAELGRDGLFTVRYGGGAVRTGPRVVVEARQPRRGGVVVDEVLVRVGPIRRVEVHRRWRRWGVDDPED